MTDVSTVAAGARISTDTLDTIFKPSVEGQVGYLTRNYAGSSTAASNFTASGLSYRAGIKLNDFLLPTGKLAVYYAGLNVKNRAYTPWNNSTDNTAGSYGDLNTWVQPSTRTACTWKATTTTCRSPTASTT